MAIGPYDKSSGSGSAPSRSGWSPLIARLMSDTDKGTAKGDGKDKKGTGKGEDKGTGNAEDTGTGKGEGKYKGTDKGEDEVTGKGEDKGTCKGAGKVEGTGKGEDEGTGKGTGKGAGKAKGTGQSAPSLWSLYLKVKKARAHALMLEEELDVIEHEMERLV